MDETTRDKLVENSQASILEGILRGGLAGGRDRRCVSS